MKMSGKVILTKKQAESLEEMKKIQHDQYETLIKEKFRGGWRSESFREANNIPFEDFVDALLVGYEIEQPMFEVGDWVVYTHDNTVWKVIGEMYGGKVHYEITKDGKNKGSIHKDHIRLATKEEIFWAELGREKDRIMINDAYQHLNGRILSVDKQERIEIVKEMITQGKILGFYPAESFKQLL